MTDQVRLQVKEIVADLFNVSEEEIDDDASPETIEAWDSLQHLNLVVALEETFNIRLEPEEIQALTSVGAITQTVEKKQSQGGG